MGSSLRLLASVARGGVILILASVSLSGCGICPRGGSPPVADVSAPARECYPSVEAPVAEGLAASLNLMAQAPPATVRPLQVLALSGGVAGVPFTAGVLVGWTDSGTRPVFDEVTGISSGALVGAYAFAGSKHDPELQRLILNLNTSDLIKFRPLRCMLCDGAFGSAKPAEQLFQTAFNDCFVAELRQAHAEGRRFFVGTMNLETKRLVIWDVGAIASSGRPDACDLVRKVLLAAVSWPGAVPPVEFDVEVNGRCHHEQHCDAGSVGMAFVRFGQLPGWPEPGTGVRPGWLAGSNLYVFANRKLYSDPVPVPKRRWVASAPRSPRSLKPSPGRTLTICILSVRFPGWASTSSPCPRNITVRRRASAICIPRKYGRFLTWAIRKAYMVLPGGSRHREPNRARRRFRGTAARSYAVAEGSEPKGSHPSSFSRSLAITE